MKKFAILLLSLIFLATLITGCDQSKPSSAEVQQASEDPLPVPDSLTPAPTHIVQTMSPATTEPRKTSILVVDDDSSFRQGIKRLLWLNRARLPSQFLEADNGEKGFEMLDFNVDCIILDYKMPGMGGLETLAEIRKVRSNVPILLSSGYDEDEVVAHMGDDVVSGFIQKPYGGAALIERLRAIGVVNR